VNRAFVVAYMLLVLILQRFCHHRLRKWKSWQKVQTVSRFAAPNPAPSPSPPFFPPPPPLSLYSCAGLATHSNSESDFLFGKSKTRWWLLRGSPCTVGYFNVD
jgi:hypothetical protein